MGCWAVLAVLVVVLWVCEASDESCWKVCGLLREKELRSGSSAQKIDVNRCCGVLTSRHMANHLAQLKVDIVDTASATGNLTILIANATSSSPGLTAVSVVKQPSLLLQRPLAVSYPSQTR